MNIPGNEPNSNINDSQKTGADQESTEQKMAVNSNPRANENVKQAPFEKTSKSDDETYGVGTEITDGEGG